MESTWHSLVVRLARTPLPLTPDSEMGSVYVLRKRVNRSSERSQPPVGKDKVTHLLTYSLLTLAFPSSTKQKFLLLYNIIIKFIFNYSLSYPHIILSPHSVVLLMHFQKPKCQK